MTRPDPQDSCRVDADPALGFIGLGVMGEPMACNVLDAGHRLVVWNRTAAKARALEAAGAVAATDVDQVFTACRTVIVMLADDRVLDQVLGRGKRAFGRRVGGRTIVNTATVAPEYSATLAAEVARHGGTYVEAPVSGSRRPAQDGSLVAMLAGEDTVLTSLDPVLAAMCAVRIRCGPPPRALLMKLAVNVHLITMVTGLVEAFHFAEQHGLDLRILADVLAAGPMSSQVSRAKADKLVAADLTPQTYARDVLYNCRLIMGEARSAAVAIPLLAACEGLFARTAQLGHGRDDFVAVRAAFPVPGRAGQ